MPKQRPELPNPELSKIRRLIEQASIVAGEGAGSAHISRDTRGRVTSIDYTNTRINFAYAGTTENIHKIMVEDLLHRSTLTFTQRPGSKSWAVTDQSGTMRGTWNGEALVTGSGFYAFKTATKENAEGLWQVHRPDTGASCYGLRFLKNGSVLTYRTENRLLNARRSDGSEIKCDYNANNFLSRITESKDGETRRSWTRLSSGRWSEEKTGNLYALHLGKWGEPHLLRVPSRNSDSTSSVDRIYHARVDKNSDNLVTKVQLPASIGGGTRIFEYEGAAVRRIVDTDSTGKKSKEIYSLEKTNDWKSVTVKSDGSFNYETVDGKLGHWQPDGKIIEHNADGTLCSITFHDGSNRFFGYDNHKRITSITDTKMVMGGSRIEQWVGDGNTLESVPQKPWRDERSSILVIKNGNYFYRDLDGRSRVAKVDDLLLKNLDSSQLHRARLELETIGKASGLNMARFRSYLDHFEKRCAEAHRQGMKAPNALQIVQTYNNLSALLQTPRKPYFHPSYCRQLAMETLGNLAYPKEHINQGVGNLTCNITTGEKFMAWRYPEKYANLVKQIAHTGEYRPGRGEPVIRPVRQTISPGPNQRGWDADRDLARDKRNGASKIVQATGIASIRAGYRGGDPQFGTREILAATRKLTGHWMPYFTEGHLPSARELLYLKSQGEFPIGVVTRSGNHVQTIFDVRERYLAGQRRNVIDVLLNDSHGINHIPGWISLEALHRRQRERPEPRPKSVPHIPPLPRRRTTG